MALTPAQKTTVKNDILANADLSAQPLTADGAYAIADLYNALAAPDFIVWKTRVSEREITSLTSDENTVWSWPAYIARNEAERNGWARMFTGTYSINPALLQVRQGLADIFSGTANSAPAQRTHLLAMGKRKATRIEKLLASGTGTTASPATMTLEGRISFQDVLDARNS